MLNHPARCHLAVAPTVALDRLAAAGLPVQPWRIGAEPASTDLVLDATGRDRWHPVGPLPDTAPHLILEPCTGPVTELLVVGDAVAGARAWPGGREWAAAVTAPEAADASAELAESACRAARVLDLDIAQVACAQGRGGLVLLGADAAPSLAAWDTLLEGAASDALARRLTELAAENRGETP